MAASGSHLRHVVLFGFKTGSSPDRLREIEETLAGLKGSIPEIQSLEWGRDVSPEGKARGHTHCFFLTFKSEADRDAYLVHPDHVAFGQLVRPHVETVTVVDYWT